MDLSIIYENSEFFILNKPFNVHSSNLPNNSNPSIASIVLKEFPLQAKVSDKSEDAGLVHRLDYETSGCLIVAKNSNSWQLLKKQQKEQKIIKTYLILTENNFIDQTITSYIGGVYRRSKKAASYSTNNAKPKRTLVGTAQFNKIKFLQKHKISIVKATTSLARRHQIRVQAAKQGFPLVGDKLYGSKLNLSNYVLKTSPSFCLHTLNVTFLDENDKEYLSVTAPIPQYFNAITDQKTLDQLYGNK